MDIWIWTGIVIVMLILEFCTQELVSIWFSAGGLVSLIAATFTDDWTLQIILFVAVSGLLLVLVRKWALKYLDKGTKRLNADALVGQKFALATAISAGEMGTLVSNGITWNCTTADQASVEAGVQVEILKISGNKLIVKEVK